MTAAHKTNMTTNRTGVYRRRSDAGLIDNTSRFHFKENTGASIELATASDEDAFITDSLPTKAEMLADDADFATVSDRYDEDALPTFVHPDYVELGVIDHFGEPIHITTEPGGNGTIEPAAEKFLVWSGHTAAEFWREDGTPLSNTWLRYAATKAYDEALLTKLNSMLGKDPNGDIALIKEIAHVRGRDAYRTGLTQPEGWEGQYPLTRASDIIGQHLQGGEINPDDAINARADYAEVGEDGIAYGMNIHENFFGEILGGQGEDEDDSDYAARIAEAFDQNKVEEFFKNEYDADVMESGDYADLNIEFFVPYGDEGAAGTSVEAMGDRVESETKLLEARDAYLHGAGMQDRFAEFFGYRTESIFDEHGYAGAKWVKDEELADV